MTPLQTLAVFGLGWVVLAILAGLWIGHQAANADDARKSAGDDEWKGPWS